jgi:flavodoxin
MRQLILTTEAKAVKKIFKIILCVIAAILLSGGVLFGLVASDFSGNTATDTHSLPNGAAIGKALIVYDPGLSGGAKDVATKIGYNLQDAGYDVLLAGVKNSAASDIEGYSVIVVGGPIYGSKPSSTIQAYLNSLNPSANVAVGAFGYGSITLDNTNQTAIAQEVAPLPSNSNVVFDSVVKVASNDNVDSLCQQFVTNLLNN